MDESEWRHRNKACEIFKSVELTADKAKCLRFIKGSVATEVGEMRQEFIIRDWSRCETNFAEPVCGMATNNRS